MTESLSNEISELTPPVTAPAATPEEFDWDNSGRGFETYRPDEKSAMETMYDKTLNTMVNHQVVMGKIIGLTNKEAVINIGYKSDGLVALSEFRHIPDLKIGDSVEVYIENQEDKNGQLILSHKKARA